MKGKKLFNIILFFLLAGTLFFTACSGDIDNGKTDSHKITISGTIRITYEYKKLPYIEIGVDHPKGDYFYTKFVPPDDSSPGDSADWSIELPAFSSETKISFKVTGYSNSNIKIFSKKIDSPKNVYNENVSGIELDLGNISNTPEKIIPLKESKWSNGEIIIPDDVQWYSFDVIKGTKYFIWWNDRDPGGDGGDGTKTLDIDVYAYNDNRLSIILEENDRAWNNPVSFTAELTGKVYIRVRALHGAAATGTYSIVYSLNNDRPDNSVIMGSEENPIPLTSGIWTDDSIPSSTSGNTIWYSFEITGGETYYVWWNDGGMLDGKKTGDGTKTLDIKVTICDDSGEPIYAIQNFLIFEIDFSWDTSSDNYRPITFEAASTGTVKLKVSPVFMNDPDKFAGTFAIVYSSKTENPDGTRPE